MTSLSLFLIAKDFHLAHGKLLAFKERVIQMSPDLVKKHTIIQK